jgi:O-succinylhomoserine sulfhydrylase
MTGPSDKEAPAVESPADWEDATKLIRGGLARTPYGETAEAMFLTQSFVYDSAEAADARFSGEQPGFVYSRYANPTTKMFEDKLALLEGAESCLSVASGMAAVASALVNLVKAGDHIVAARALFGSCRWILATYLPRFGVECTFVDGPNLDEWKAAVRPNTRLFFLESPANPLLEVIDIAAVSALARAQGAKLVVDNTFATPIFQKPLALGADVVVYSGTKHIDGAGRVLGGAILGPAQLLDESYRDFLRHTGPAISPFNAWVLLKGMETLDLRVRRQSETAATIAERMADHSKVKRLFYPLHPSHPQYAVASKQMSGGSNIIALDLGDQAAAFRFLDALQIVDISNNLGDAKSLATHPSTTTNRSVGEEERLRIGLTAGCVRLSVGLEGLNDLWRDLARALEAA